MSVCYLRVIAANKWKTPTEYKLDRVWHCFFWVSDSLASKVPCSWITGRTSMGEGHDFALRSRLWSEMIGYDNAYLDCDSS